MRSTKHAGPGTSRGSPAQDLSARDWFAGQALTGILMNPNTPKPGDTVFEVHAASIAEQAYAYAEAMLRQRLQAEG